MAACAGNVVARTTYHYEHGSFEMLAIQATRQSDYQLNAHDQCAWVAWNDLPTYELAPADLLLMEQLQTARR